MNPIYLIALVQIIPKIVAFKSDHAVKRQSKSIFSGKRYIETITPARYSAGNHIKYDNSPSHNFIPERYFPDVEYPINLLEASKPFYSIAGANDALFSPYTKDVLTNYNSALKIKPATNKVNTGTLNGYAPIIKDSKNVKSFIMQTDISNLGVTDNLATVQRSNLNKNISTANLSDSRDPNQGLLKNITLIELENIESAKMILPLPDSNEHEAKYYDYTDCSADIEEQVEVFYVDDNGAVLGNESAEDASISEYSTTDISNTLQDSEPEFNDEFVISSISVESDNFPSKICLLPTQNNETQLNTTRKPPKRSLSFLKY